MRQFTSIFYSGDDIEILLLLRLSSVYNLTNDMQYLPLHLVGLSSFKTTRKVVSSFPTYYIFLGVRAAGQSSATPATSVLTVREQARRQSGQDTSPPGPPAATATGRRSSSSTSAWSVKGVARKLTTLLSLSTFLQVNIKH